MSGVSLTFFSVRLHKWIKALPFFPIRLHNKHPWFFFFSSPPAVCKTSWYGGGGGGGGEGGTLAAKTWRERETPTSTPDPLVQSSLIKAGAFFCYRQVHLQTTIHQTCAPSLQACNKFRKSDLWSQSFRETEWSVSTACIFYPSPLLFLRGWIVPHRHWYRIDGAEHYVD